MHTLKIPTQTNQNHFKKMTRLQKKIVL